MDHICCPNGSQDTMRVLSSQRNVPWMSCVLLGYLENYCSPHYFSNLRDISIVISELDPDDLILFKYIYKIFTRIKDIVIFYKYI